MDKLSTDNLEWQSLYWIAQPQFQTQTHYRRLNINANVMLETTFFSTVQINGHRPPQYISRCRIYLWLFAFTRFSRKIPLCINELDMAGHVWCDECYLVDWLLLHGFIPHHSVRYKYHHPMQVKVHTLKYTFTAIKKLLQPCSKLLGR